MDGLCGGLGVGGFQHRPPDDEIIGASRDRTAGRHDALLVTGRRTCRPDAGGDEAHLVADDLAQIADFLLPMLDLMPEGRANAGGMSNHDFLKATKGMDQVKLDIPIGSKGEGIEGWASEVKKR